MHRYYGRVGTMGVSVRWGRRNYGCTGTMDAPELWVHRHYGCSGTLDAPGLWACRTLRYTKYEEEIGWDFLTILEVK